jgi:hypothetical protein
LRQIGLDDRLASRGVLTVPLCPDRYTASDKKTPANQLVPCVAFVHRQPRASVNTAALLRSVAKIRDADSE